MWTLGFLMLSLSERSQANILQTRCFDELQRKLLRFKGNCCIYKEADISQPIFCCFMAFLPGSFSVTSSHPIPAEMQTLLAWTSWAGFCCMAHCWHRRFGPFLSWRHNPPVKPLKQGGNHSCMVYAASIISNLFPLLRFIKQDISITFPEFNGKLGDIFGS